MKRICFFLMFSVMVMLPLRSMAICEGHSNSVDMYYSSANPVANMSPELGWDWQVQTTSAGVEIKVHFLDNYVGMAAPQLFTFDANGVLIGNPIPMSGWDEATHTASHTVTGLKDGDSFVFLVQIAYADHVLFTERIKYIVGSECSADEQPVVIGSCSGHSTGVDDFYTSNDPAAANPFVKGYDWSVTTTDKGVDIEVKFLDNIEGFAAPYIFFFKDGVLDGGDKPMELFGQTASYSLSGKQAGDEINFLVKIAYVQHVAFTERIAYVVGESCDPETSLVNVKDSGKRVRKVVENGNIYIVRDGGKYNLLGSKVE